MIHDRTAHILIGFGFFTLGTVIKAVIERAVNSACSVCGHKKYKRRPRPWDS